MLFNRQFLYKDNVMDINVVIHLCFLFVHAFYQLQNKKVMLVSMKFSTFGNNAYVMLPIAYFHLWINVQRDNQVASIYKLIELLLYWYFYQEQIYENARGIFRLVHL